MKSTSSPNFRLECNCFLQVSKGARAQGMDIPGVYFYSDIEGNSGLSMVVVKRLLKPDGSKQVGALHFNFCPFCGKQIVVKLAKVESDEKTTESE